MTRSSDVGLRRARASLHDLGLLVVALGPPIAVVALIRTRSGRPTTRRAGVNLALDAVLTVIPAVGVLVLSDSSPAGSKGCAGLRIETVQGETVAGETLVRATPCRGRLAVRAAVKLTAWQLGHLGARQQAGQLGGRVGTVAGIAALSGSMVLAGTDVVLAVRSSGRRRSLHDLVAGTCVAD